MQKRIIKALVFDGEALRGAESGEKIEGGYFRYAVEEAAAGLGGLYVREEGSGDAAHDKYIAALLELCRGKALKVCASVHMKKQEDIKKVLYAGCAFAAGDALRDTAVLKDGSERFGRDRIAAVLRGEDLKAILGGANPEGAAEEFEGCGAAEVIEEIASFASVLVLDGADPVSAAAAAKAAEGAGIRAAAASPAMGIEEGAGFLANEAASAAAVRLGAEGVEGARAAMAAAGLDMNAFASGVSFSEMKKDQAGLVPTVVQDDETDEVLMLAYMNEESFNKTLQTGVMTYYSRSRRELWKKGETSGNYQFVRSLSIDCDKDTLLARVVPVGPACHTGNRTCFYTKLDESEAAARKKPYEVLEEVYGVIMDRKENPKDGSYTNYLFNKGIDKILKKVGEECAEILIAAKNPDPEETKYEISDYLYHLMVLMAEKGITWEDVTEELARR